ncbi:MAG: AI-2E family transporter [Proteobacteria bacterium]|nr:AI-2E family transporter [Pseudomonadota bacterium]MBU1596159.1 AI-2E family transporter [Pseudomonadota bacterium]
MNSAPETPDTPIPPRHSSKIFSYFMLFFLVVGLVLGFVLVEPFMHTIIISAVLAIIFSPLYVRISSRLGERANLAAGITVAIVVFALILPTAFLAWGLVTQGLDAVRTVTLWMDKNDAGSFFRDHPLEPYLAWLRAKLPFLDISEATIQAKLIQYLRGVAQSIFDTSATLVGNMTKLLLRFFIMIFMVFYFLREGRVMVQKLKFLAPLPTHQEDVIIDSLQRVARAVLFGSLLIALLQGLAGALGLYIVGIKPLFWGTMMGLAALIPVIGTGLVWIPVAAYLYLFVNPSWAMFFLLWNVLLVTSIDTILRPILMRKAAQVSPFYIFFAILGGIHAFGALGIFYGPLILSFLMVMLKIYSEEYSELLTSRTGFKTYRNEP